MKDKYSVIVADPAWSFSDSLSMSSVKRSAESNYSVMSVKDIKALPVKGVSDPGGCILALWVPSALLKEGLDVMNAWEFEFKQTYIWVKSKKEPLKDLVDTITDLPSLKDKIITKSSLKGIASEIKKECEVQLNNLLGFGMGRLFRNTHEIALIGINNKDIYKKLQNHSQRTVCIEPNVKHSAKPENLQDALEAMFPDANKLELFGRRKRYGWTVLGNEVCNGEDIRTSLSKLISE